MINKIKLLALSLVCISQLSNASIIDATDVESNPGTCNQFNVNLTHISTHDDDTTLVNESEINLLTSNYNSTACAGVYSGNEDNIKVTGDNIGTYGSNLLNGGNDFFTGYEFINPEADLQNLDNSVDPSIANLKVFDTNRDDPGWIHLAGFDAETNNTSYSKIFTTSISSLLDITFECTSGTGFGDCTAFNWTLTTDEDIVQNTRDLIGPSTFDHLAFSLKSSTGFAVYDFNFKSIFQSEVDAGNALFGQPAAFETAFILGGTVKMNDFTNHKGKAQGISHINVFARDPADINTVPEPSTIAIFGLSLIGLSLRKKQS